MSPDSAKPLEQAWPVLRSRESFPDTSNSLCSQGLLSIPNHQLDDWQQEASAH